MLSVFFCAYILLYGIYIYCGARSVSDKIVSLYRARLSKEKGTVRKDWGGKITIALTYPNSYRIGMSNLGFQIVYHLLNQKKLVVAERVFLPEDHEMSLYLETGKELLSLESQSPLQKFDMVAFSLSFEHDYPNILRILQLGKIPLVWTERDDSHPFIMAGGVTTFLNPEPLAPFFDFFLLGEAEENLDGFIELFIGLTSTRESKRERLKILAKNMKSVYVPSLYHVEYHRDGTIRSMEPTEKDIPPKIEVAHHLSSERSVAVSKVLTPDTEFKDRVLIELGRGCGRSCRFCAAGYVYRPPRFQREGDLLSHTEKLMDRHKRFGLLSTSVFDTPGIEHIMSFIVKKGGDFSISSLRADSLTPELADLLKKGGQKTLAFAPEAGSERLRRVVNKHLTRGQILEAVRIAAHTAGFNLRLYFMIGLPTESQEDVNGILGLVKSIKHQLVKESSPRGKIGQIRLSINCFVPKPFTPFQWFPTEHVSVLKEKQKWLKKALSRIGGVKVNFDVPKWAYVQSLLSLGDRRVGSILLLSHQKKGDWMRALRFSETNPDFFVYRPKGQDEILPWDFIDHGIFKEYLIKEYKLALKEEESDVCRVGQCDRCGVC